MKNIKYLLFSFVTIFLFFNPTFAIPKITSNRSLYLGYYGLNGWSYNETSKVVDHTNLIYIREDDDNTSKSTWATTGTQTFKILNDIKYNYSGLKALVDISPIFFNPQSFRLYPNYEERWNTYIQNLSGYGFESLVGGLYSLDEAYAVGASAGISFGDMKVQLEVVSSVIKRTFPNLPLALSFTSSTYTLPIPNGYDWIGLDCYGNWDNCDGHSMPFYFSSLESRLAPNQSLMLFPDSSLFHGDTNQPEQIERIKKYFWWAQTHPKVAAIIPFLWWNFPGQDIVGAESLPLTQSAMRTFSHKIFNDIPILPDASGLKPQVIASGTGCSDNQCIWLILNNIETDVRIDIRKIENGGTQFNWIYSHDKINIRLLPNGYYELTFRLNEPEAITELKIQGINLWVTNPKSGIWTDKIFVK